MRAIPCVTYWPAIPSQLLALARAHSLLGPAAPALAGGADADDETAELAQLGGEASPVPAPIVFSVASSQRTADDLARPDAFESQPTPGTHRQPLDVGDRIKYIDQVGGAQCAARLTTCAMTHRLCVAQLRAEVPATVWEIRDRNGAPELLLSDGHMYGAACR